MTVIAPASGSTAPSGSGAAPAPGKGHRDENFPVASFLLKPVHRAPIMAFYRFARVADDVADHASLSAPEKIAMLAAMRRGLDAPDGDPIARALGAVLRTRALDPAPARDLLAAFEHDVAATHYADWDALIAYCRLSAMPVGRFVLDVHGENRDLWPASDALCAALQLINHLQDCRKDYRDLNRVYIPADMLAAAGAARADLAEPRASAALRRALDAVLAGVRDLLAQSAGFARRIDDRRLAAEVAVIHRLAVSLTGRLAARDPLAQRVHHHPAEALGLAVGAALGSVLRGALGSGLRGAQGSVLGGAGPR